MMRTRTFVSSAVICATVPRPQPPHPFPSRSCANQHKEAADNRLPSPRRAAGFRPEQNAFVPVLNDELSAGLPSMGRLERLRKNDLALCRQFRRLIHGKIDGKMIAGYEKIFGRGTITERSESEDHDAESSSPNNSSIGIPEARDNAIWAKPTRCWSPF